VKLKLWVNCLGKIDNVARMIGGRQMGTRPMLYLTLMTPLNPPHQYVNTTCAYEYSMQSRDQPTMLGPSPQFWNTASGILRRSQKQAKMKFVIE
jgi:hypothetical protein